MDYEEEIVLVDVSLLSEIVKANEIPSVGNFRQESTEASSTLHIADFSYDCVVKRSIGSICLFEKDSQSDVIKLQDIVSKVYSIEKLCPYQESPNFASSSLGEVFEGDSTQRTTHMAL